MARFSNKRNAVVALPRHHAWLARATFAAALLLAATAAQAGSVYRCLNAAGRLTFRDTPCAAHSRQQKLDVAGQPLIDPSAPRHAISHTTRPHRTVHARRTRSRRARKPKPVMSWECRAADGEVFYQHHRCPASVRGDGTVRIRYAETSASGRSRRRHNAWSAVRVHGVKIPRAEACRRIHSAGAAVRDGHLRDQDVSTYDHLMGRDPCGAY